MKLKKKFIKKNKKARGEIRDIKRISKYVNNRYVQITFLAIFCREIPWCSRLISMSPIDSLELAQF